MKNNNKTEIRKVFAERLKNELEFRFGSIESFLKTNPNLTEIINQYINCERKLDISELFEIGEKMHVNILFLFSKDYELGKDETECYEFLKEIYNGDK